MIKVTETAKDEVKRMFSEHDLQDSVLRMGVRGGGCSGLSYTLGFDKEVSEYDSVFEVEEGVKVVVDMKSFLYLKGTELDFTTDLIGGGLSLIHI